MFSFAKFLRISLPVATGACAIVATTLLVASMHDKDKLKKNENDEILKDLEKPTEEFKEEKIINEEQEENKETDSEKEKDAKGSQEEKTKKTEEYDSNIGKELVERVMRGEEITLGEETLRGKGDTSESKPDDVSQLTEENSPPQEGLPSEESPSIPSGDLELPAESPQPPEEKVVAQTPESSEQLESTELDSIPKEKEDSGDPKEQESVQEAEALDEVTTNSEEGENVDIPVDEGQAQQESTPQGNDEAKGEEGEPAGDARAEAVEGQEESQTHSSGKDDDGIEGGTAEETLPNLDFLNSLEGKLNNEINSLGGRLRSLGIRV